MQCGELFAELFCIAARRQFQVFQHQIALPAVTAVHDGSRHAHRFCRGDRFQTGGFGNKHVQMPGFVQFDEIACAVRSFQPVSLVDTATADRCRAAHFERAMRRIMNC